MRIPIVQIATSLAIAAASVPAAAGPAIPAADLACLARTLYHEARGEGPVGMVAVGHVVLNRASDGRDICEVVYERRPASCQFSWACKHPVIGEPEAWRRSKAVAEALLEEAPPPDPTGGATHFGRCSATRGWARVHSRTARIGSHCFYRPRDAGPAAAGHERVDYEIVEDPGRPHGITLTVSPRG